MAMNYNSQTKGYLDDPTIRVRHKVIIEGDKAHEIHIVIVHRFKMSDVEDPELYAAQPIWEWQQTEKGKWVMKHSVDSPVWHRHMDVSIYGYEYAITAKLKGADFTYYTLKWGSA